MEGRLRSVVHVNVSFLQAVSSHFKPFRSFATVSFDRGNGPTNEYINRWPGYYITEREREKRDRREKEMKGTALPG